jgi:LmbE family N-acetylglucosaminyl deacetylase
VRTGKRIVVVSPHSDDGVLSLGAFMASRARVGDAVELLTVLALDPDSAAESGGWDRRGGFRTEGEAARARREEDRHACAILGATPRWLPFGSVDYERHGSESTVLEAVREAVDGADVVLVPGSPLTHPDHAWLASVLEALPQERVARYAEEPYTWREGGSPFTRVSAPRRDRLAKWRAIRAYRSQLSLLDIRGLRRGAHRLAWRAERISWPH